VFFAPANISLVFETYEASAAGGRGSLGVGITLDEGVTAKVVPDKPPGIYVGRKKWAFPTVAQVIEEMTTVPVRIELTAAFPFGCGFGMSGASALATAYALNAWLAENGRPTKSRDELGMIAHRAEVANATGLGDVGGQFNGGIMIKTRKYEPLTVEQLPFSCDELHVQIFGPIHTADVIGSREKLGAINAAGRRALDQITDAGKSLTINELLDFSLNFAVDSELLQSSRLRDAIEKIRSASGHASMIMLGEAVVSSTPFAGSRTVKVLRTAPKDGRLQGV
jgi:pantoate kinase